MNSLEREKPQRLLDNAVAFYEASRRCDTLSIASTPPHKVVELRAPTVVCVVFSIELFLKLLHLLEAGKYPKHHDLCCLFCSLPGEVQTEINGNFSGVRGASYYLEDARKAFADWRYLHEKTFLSASYEELTAIADALHKTVRDRRPELVSVFEQ